MFADSPRIIHVAGLVDDDLDAAPLNPDQIEAGLPEVRHLPVIDDGDLAVGVWQHSVGVSNDVEADEMFVVIRGRATIEFDNGDTLEIGPGDLVAYPPGTRTRWTIHETLRKVYVIRHP